jgi:DNA repair protein RecN (Recombination protein N)
MLSSLEIENYGLIEAARIEFSGGATIFTGETGSGKTMLLGALGFALGARAAADAVRRGAPKALVTLAFDPNDALRARLAADGFELDPGETATIAREMTDTGRSSLRLNGRPATAAYVRELAEAIVEIVGQHEAQRLLVPAYHRRLLDGFGGTATLRARDAVARAHAALETRTAELTRLQGDELAAQARLEDAAFALHEIESVRPEPGEIERHRERRLYLENVQRIAGALGRAHGALAGEGGVIEALGNAGAALASLEEIGPRFAAMAETAAALQSQTNDLAAGVAGALDTGDLDPAELDAVNARLDALERLERKYGGSLEAVLANAQRAQAAVDALQGRDRREAELKAGVDAARAELEAAAAALGALRRKAAAALVKRVTTELPDLALGAGRFDVSFEPLERIGADGAERIEFLFAANAGEPARVLTRVASGGELSRLMLALIVVLAGARDDAAALVFDEIDTGIGGATGTAVGARIGRLAREGQVVCVTHLAQLATWADRHYVLEKTERKAATTIAVREIAATDERTEELARMLSGEKHDVALKHARALLQRARATPL